MMQGESDKERHARQYGELIARAWSDRDFKARLIENPKAAMAELGIATIPDVEVVVLEATKKRAYLVIPPEPEEPIKDLDLTAYSAHYYIDGSG